MNPIAILHALIAAGVEVKAEYGRLSMRGPVLDPGLMRQAEGVRVELGTLLDGSTCRHCRGPIQWHGTTAVALADGTSLHGECRAPWRDAR